MCFNEKFAKKKNSCFPQCYATLVPGFFFFSLEERRATKLLGGYLVVGQPTVLWVGYCVLSFCVGYLWYRTLMDRVVSPLMQMNYANELVHMCDRAIRNTKKQPV